MSERPPWIDQAEASCPWLVGQRLKDAIVQAARPAADVLCDERELLALRRAIREYDEWQEMERQEAQR